MNRTTFWAAYIAAFRKLHGLTQSELSERLGVASPTISRWESGRQIPDLLSQKNLKQTLGVCSLMSTEDWIVRVNSSHGFEVLIDEDLKVRALSDTVVKFWRRGRNEYIGRSFEDFLPGGHDKNSAELARFGVAGFKEIGLFEGKIKHIYMIVDYVIPEISQRRAYDAWPVLTSADQTFAHFVGYPEELVKTEGEASTLVIRHCEIELNSAIDPLAGAKGKR